MPRAPLRLHRPPRRPLARGGLLAILGLTLAGCAFRDVGIPDVYKTTIQQGNVITQEMIDQLEPGMTPRQVRFVLGEPILGNTFRGNRWDYVYTLQVGDRPRQQQRLTVFFEDGALTRFAGDFVPTAVRERNEAAAEDIETTDTLLPGNA